MAFHRLNKACNFVKCTSCSLVDHVYGGERIGIRELMSGAASQSLKTQTDRTSCVFVHNGKRLAKRDNMMSLN